MRAREHLDPLEFRLERLLVASDRLTARHADATKRANAKAAEVHKREAIAKRDELVAQIQEVYPRLAGCGTPESWSVCPMPGSLHSLGSISLDPFPRRVSCLRCAGGA